MTHFVISIVANGSAQSILLANGKSVHLVPFSLRIVIGFCGTQSATHKSFMAQCNICVCVSICLAGRLPMWHLVRFELASQMPNAYRDLLHILRGRRRLHRRLRDIQSQLKCMTSSSIHMRDAHNLRSLRVRIIIARTPLKSNSILFQFVLYEKTVIGACAIQPFSFTIAFGQSIDWLLVTINHVIEFAGAHKYTQWFPQKNSKMELKTFIRSRTICTKHTHRTIPFIHFVRSILRFNPIQFVLVFESNRFIRLKMCGTRECTREKSHGAAENRREQWRTNEYNKKINWHFDGELGEILFDLCWHVNCWVPFYTQREI